MTTHIRDFVPEGGRPAPEGLIKLAVLAVGGQGGGVLSNWIVDLAEQNGYRAQTTSVPGVAQRTGATIYYVEMMPDEGREPVFALMPSPGDVDILIAAEIMEAGRAITRGFVTSDRTTLIASSHRMYAVSEKIVPGDGRAGTEAVLPVAAEMSRAFICFDMEQVAAAAKSHISASLFGALAGSGALPFEREAYEQTIRASGRGVEASLKAFASAYDRAGGAVEPAPEPAPAIALAAAPAPAGPSGLVEVWAGLTARIALLPATAQDMVRRGVEKVVDFQDVDYGDEYLAAVEKAAARDADHGGAMHQFAFTVALAKHLANAMCYDDVIRVADLKTRGSRFARVRADVGVGDDAVVKITEFMHPRAEEICGMMPARLGRRVEASPRVFGLIDRLFNRGRRVRTDAPLPFLMLYGLAGMRRFRRSLLRHEMECDHRARWLARAYEALDHDYALAVELINCRRLVKGYSDTHARGLSKFDRVLDAARLVEDRVDAADWVRRLRDAALKDEKGTELDGAVATIRSFVGDDADRTTSAQS
ncbi:indolepyruvate oxidoreductase subunit beta family protein [Pararhizobium haloflavum]|uniref:indolepyruvate oxidoreductase subunit beta family protein n=1 Tax=Pararhizobium haloflavum TaxID=2037914 RepID=UPI000C17A38C|nr:indolepyruvate oxidoreductase subunit beta family protein [Pararhizobium haloflavum]